MAHSTKSVTLEDLQNIIKELGKVQQEVAKAQQEVAEAQRETEKSMQEVHQAQRETGKSMQEVHRAQRETGKSMQEVHRAQRETEKSMQEVHQAQRETEKSMQEVHQAQKETKMAQQKTEKSLRELRKSLNEANGNFNNKWGAFIERLVSGDLVSLLKEWGLPVEEITSRKVLYRQDKSQFGEYDLIAYNGEALVVVEVKTTLTRDKIDKFIHKLKHFRKDKAGFSHKKTIYGGVGFLDADEETPQYAEEQGLFVIRAPGGESNASTILNDRKTFAPVEF